MVWEVDGSELVTAADFAKESRLEMEAFDRLPEHRKRELRASGQSALAFLEWERKQRRQNRGWLGNLLDW
jgi:hypothetical protein